uniref:inactive serine/threonine-protein kinase TEX14 n=1 Tax=Pristiophorus japonicus TaxID=55135 RepID=UPI00398E95DA
MSHMVPLPVPCPVQLGSVKADTSGSQLHQFVREGNHTKVKKILKKGVAVDTRNSLGQTPLFIAALLDLVKVVDVLLEFGANPNHRCDDRSTPVHASAFSCNQWILSKLLDAGGDLRLNDKDGRIPRTWAKSAGKEHSTRILEFMQRCASHMQGITQQIVCSNSRRVGSSSQALIRNPSILNKITYGNKDVEFLNIPKARSISSQSVQCFGFGKFYVHGPAQLAYLASIPIVNEKELVQADDEPTFSYANGPYTTMTNLTWNGIRVTVRYMNLPTHQNCSKRLSADLLIAEQEYNSQLRHPSFLLLMAVCQLSDLDQIRLVYERIHLGSLYGVLHERRSEFPVLLVEMIVQMLLQITDAVLYLHSRGYIHRAVTSHAVQLVLPGIAKLSNFEYMVESVDGGTHSNLSRCPIPPQFYNWLAPEIIRGKPATIKSDVYSLCTLIQELFTDAVPWEDLDGFALKESIAAGRYLTVDGQVPQPYYDIVRTGIEVKPQNRTMNLQDIRFILRNDIKDLISNQQKHAFENIQSEVRSLYDDIGKSVAASSDRAGYRREQGQLQEENAGKGRKSEYLEQAQITTENHDSSYYNMGHRTSFSPKNEREQDGDIIDLNHEPTQQITVLYDCWNTEQNRPEDTAGSRDQEKVYNKDKLSNDYSPWNTIEQHYNSEPAENQPAKHDTDVLEQLHDLDLALEQEMDGTYDKEFANDDLETGLLRYSDTHRGTGTNSEGDSSTYLETATEYASDEEDEQSDGTPSDSQEWSGVEDAASDHEKHGPISSHALTSRALEEGQNIETSLSIQHSISSCTINIQTSKHLVQQAFSALDNIKRYSPEVSTAQNAREAEGMGDLQLLERAPYTKLPGFDEVDCPRDNEKDDKRMKPCNEGHLVIPVAVAPPRCYQLPVYRVDRRQGADPVGRFQPASKILSQTQGEQETVAHGRGSDVLKTSDTFADGTQTTCSLRKQVNDEETDYRSALNENFKTISQHKDKVTTRSKKKMNIFAHAHDQDTVPARKGRISMRIPAQGKQQGYRKQCMYLSGNRKIRITQSCNIASEGIKVRQKKMPEVYQLTSTEKAHHQNQLKESKAKSEQTPRNTNWTNEVTEMIEKMASGCLSVAQGEPREEGSPHTESVDEEELFRRFAKLPSHKKERHWPYNRHHGNSSERTELEQGHLGLQQMQCSPHNNTPDETLVDSGSSVDVEETFQSFAGQRESFDSQVSGCSDIEITNLDKTFITTRVRKKALKEKTQHFSLSDSSFSVSDEFFTPNPELVSLCSETLTNTDLTENQLTKESTSSEEELEITREVCQKNTGPLRCSSSSDTDSVDGKTVKQKVTVQRSSDRDRSRVLKPSFTPSAGVPQAGEVGLTTSLNHNHPAQAPKAALRKDEISFSDIQDLSYIPSDGHFANPLLLSKTPSSTRAPIDNSTPYPVSTAKDVSSGHWPHYTRFEPVLLQTKISETSPWPSPDSSAISPGTFTTACDETSKMQTPITPPERQPSKIIGPTAPSGLGVTNAPSESVSGRPSAAPPGTPAQRTGATAGPSEEAVKSGPGTPAGSLPGGQGITVAARGSASCGSPSSAIVSKTGEEADGMSGMCDKQNQGRRCENFLQLKHISRGSIGTKANEMPERIMSGGIVQEFGEDQKEEKIEPERQQEANQDVLEHPSDWERCSLQKSMEETERAHSTLDSVLEEMMESQGHLKGEISKVWTKGNDAVRGEALRVSQEEECSASGKQTNIATAQGAAKGASESRPGTSASIAPASSVNEESSSQNQIPRVNWTQPHRVIILE